jgi:hypothetical protein
MKRVLLCVLVVLAGCGDPGAIADSDGSGDIGRVNGYAYDDPVAVNVTDGLNGSEREAVVSRAMARVERLRELEFERDVDVRLMTRAEYRANRSGGSDGGTHAEWNDQVWEGLFLVGEGRPAAGVLDDTLGSSVLGYYAAGSDELVIVADGDQPVLARGTLVHELVHALQDQQFGLDESPDTQDRQLARNGVVEGEANLLEARYEQRCGQEWDCIDTPPRAGSGGGDVDRGVLLVVLMPYLSGPDFVTAIERRGGWAAVDDLHDSYPVSTEQILDPSTYSDDTPVNVTVPDRSSGDWHRFDHDPVADTVGRASIHAMFYQNGIEAASVQRYSYAHPAAEGWDGDALVPYRNGDRRGYVWETAWESPDEARQFADAYRKLLESKGATVEGSVAVIPESSPFGDAFRVTREGTRVRVVNGPARGALPEIHAG